MSNLSFNRFMWWFFIYLIQITGFIFQFSPNILPRHEGLKLQKEASNCDVLIIFNPGGWGDATLNRATDFAPILEGISDNIKRLGYHSHIVPYVRTLPSLIGRISGTKEQLNSYRHNSLVLAEDIRAVATAFPDKRFIVVGFSTGGGLNGRTLKYIDHLPNIYGITVGVPGWFQTYSSQKSLVLNNNNLDPLSVGNVKTIAATVFKSPFIWLKARAQGRKLSLALSLQFPYHEYSWSSQEIKTPIIKFLEFHLKSSSITDTTV